MVTCAAGAELLDVARLDVVDTVSPEALEPQLQRDPSPGLVLDNLHDGDAARVS